MPLEISGFNNNNNNNNNNNIWKLNSVSICHLVILTEEVAIKNFIKYLENIGLTKKLRSGANSSNITNMS